MEHNEFFICKCRFCANFVDASDTLDENFGPENIMLIKWFYQQASDISSGTLICSTCKRLCEYIITTGKAGLDRKSVKYCPRYKLPSSNYRETWTVSKSKILAKIEIFV